MLLAFAISAPLAFGQLDSNSVTVTASRGTSLQPDQAVFGVFVDSGLSSSLDDILAALKGSGITIANFSGVSTVNQPVILPTGSGSSTGLPQTIQPTLEWTFGLPVALSKIAETVKALSSLQSSIMQNAAGLTLSFSVQGTQVSQQLQQSQTCVFSDLISDAQTQAQKLASAAGLGVGSILAMSSPVVTSVSNGNVVAGVSISRFISPIVSSPLLAPVCTVTVKFALGRF